MEDYNKEFKINIPKKQPEYYISDNGVIEYIGSAKDGHWIVKEQG